jgi:hypothetical protein
LLVPELLELPPVPDELAPPEELPVPEAPEDPLVPLLPVLELLPLGVLLPALDPIPLLDAPLLAPLLLAPPERRACRVLLSSRPVAFMPFDCW